jgi:hypothetical protein
MQLSVGSHGNAVNYNWVHLLINILFSGQVFRPCTYLEGFLKPCTLSSKELNAGHSYLSNFHQKYIICRKVEFFKYIFCQSRNFLWTYKESHQLFEFLGMESSKLTNLWTDMCWSCPWISGVVKLFSAIYSKLIKVLVHKKGYR